MLEEFKPDVKNLYKFNKIYITTKNEEEKYIENTIEMNNIDTSVIDSIMASIHIPYIISDDKCLFTKFGDMDCIDAFIGDCLGDILRTHSSNLLIILNDKQELELDEEERKIIKDDDTINTIEGCLSEYDPGRYDMKPGFNKYKTYLFNHDNNHCALWTYGKLDANKNQYKFDKYISKIFNLFFNNMYNYTYIPSSERHTINLDFLINNSIYMNSYAETIDPRIKHLHSPNNCHLQYGILDEDELELYNESDNNIMVEVVD